MSKQKLLNLVDVISYFAIINATIFVLLFEFSGSVLSLNVALISYIIAFLAIAIFGIVRLNFANRAEQSSEDYLSTKQKVWLIIKTILSFALLAFCIIIFLNY